MWERERGSLICKKMANDLNCTSWPWTWAFEVDMFLFLKQRMFQKCVWKEIPSTSGSRDTMGIAEKLPPSILPLVWAVSKEPVKLKIQIHSNLRDRLGAFVQQIMAVMGVKWKEYVGPACIIVLESWAVWSFWFLCCCCCCFGKPIFSHCLKVNYKTGKNFKSYKIKNSQNSSKHTS